MFQRKPSLNYNQPPSLLSVFCFSLPCTFRPVFNHFLSPLNSLLAHFSPLIFMFLSLPPLVFHIFIFYQRCCVANFIYLFIYLQALVIGDWGDQPNAAVKYSLFTLSFSPSFLSPCPLSIVHMQKTCFQARLLHCSWCYFNSASDVMLMSSVKPVTNDFIGDSFFQIW